MCATYSEKQKRSHFESFANKIFTGIREINPEYAEKRAIWELFQNALDTVDKDGVIDIIQTKDGFMFRHNGRPFKDDEFGGLIKQFSVGKTYGDNKEKLGQYGTGFISTHVYGKKIKVNGDILTDDGTYRSLHNFDLDRDAETVEALTDKLILQDDIITQLCESPDATSLSPTCLTTFEYVAGSGNRIHINTMLEYVESILPYIFCFNDKLLKVCLHCNTIKNDYCRKEASDGITSILINGAPLDIPYVYDAQKSVKVILGAENRNLTKIPKQFLFYPLMDTVNIGVNFIIHANNFKPNRERDYLYKDTGNLDVKADVETNESLLKVGFNLAINEIIRNENLLVMDFANIRFVDSDLEFERGLKSEYILSISDLARIDVNSSKKSLSSLQFFDNLILLLDDVLRSSVYKLLSQFRQLPPYEDYCKLSEYVNNWNSIIERKFECLSLEDIGEIIVNEGGGNYYYINDKVSYKNFITAISADISLLNRLALLPNIHGNFKCFEFLVKWEKKEPILIDIVDKIEALITDKFIHQDFEDLANLNIYNREKFKDDFSKFCNQFSDIIDKEKVEFKISTVRFIMLVESLTNFVALNKKTQLNIDVVIFYERVFKLDAFESEIIDPSVDINYQPAIKLLANLYINNIGGTEIQNHTSDLLEIISVMFRNTNLKEELLQKLACLPNQNYVLKSQKELKRDEVKDNDFKNQYDTLTNNKIRTDLAFDGFEIFLQHEGKMLGFELGEAIENSLNAEKKFIPVDLNVIDSLLKLIEKISEKPSTWGQWLPNINKVKEEILMHKFKDEKTRSSLFSILTKDEKTIELLGNLAKIDDLEGLIEAGNQKLKEAERAKNHLDHIKKVGLKIQDIIQQELDLTLAETIQIINTTTGEKLDNVEQQNGQDFIIYKSGIPIYYIEVKSRWDSDGVVALSKRQIECCAANKDKYAVITVNVADYKSRNKGISEVVSFEDLYNDIYINIDLGENFEQLIKENQQFERITDNTKLIEFRGHIPQSRIRNQSIGFTEFITNLKTIIVNHAQPN
ncbi:MAG: DUF3883 domain-containing protein [Bacteroidota bacterium]